ncbi:MAG: sel1 repeat family protein [Alphaproteobacteria bacterium]|nr:sel1 repeat family protein [Alphaproteobacteria bacterium]
MRKKIKVWVVGGITAGAIMAGPGGTIAGQKTEAPPDRATRSTSNIADTLEGCAKTGNPVCQAALGTMFESGQSVPHDYRKAFELMLRAAKAGYLPAQRSVGISYFIGRGVTKDEKEATYWLAKAADRDDDEAILLYYHLVELTETGIGC